MNLNIYGVGRSGTKVVQLYLAYLMAKKYDFVKVNYEPYYWQHRLLKYPNYEGINFHVKQPQFIHSQDKLDDGHKAFLEKMKASKGLPTITKFIRANGRIEKINQLLSPDWNIIVFRQLADVLASLAEQAFNFYSVGHRLEQSFWKGLKKEILHQTKFEPIHHLVKKAKDSTLKNAIYWYVMNIDALDNQVENKVIVRYEHFQEDLLYLKTMLQLDGISALENRIDLFRGKKIHSNSILSTKNIHTPSNFLYQKIAYFLFRSLPLYQPRSNEIGTIDAANRDVEMNITKPIISTIVKSNHISELKKREEIIFLQQRITERLDLAMIAASQKR